MNGLNTQYLFAVLIIALIVVIALTRVGALWLRLAWIDILAAMFVVRIDKIGVYLGIDTVSDSVADLITLLVLAVLLFSFLSAYRRRVYLMRAERQRQADLYLKNQQKINDLEILRKRSERGISWNQAYKRLP